MLYISICHLVKDFSLPLLMLSTFEKRIYFRSNSQLIKHLWLGILAGIFKRNIFRPISLLNIRRFKRKK